MQVTVWAAQVPSAWQSRAASPLWMWSGAQMGVTEVEAGAPEGAVVPGAATAKPGGDNVESGSKRRIEHIEPKMFFLTFQGQILRALDQQQQLPRSH